MNSSKKIKKDKSKETTNTEQKESKTDQIPTVSQTEFEEMKETAMRALADLQNYKRRAEEERVNLLNMGKINILTELFPVLDNFTRAFQHIPEDIKKNDWVNGVSQIEQQLAGIIENLGIQEIPSIDTPADPHLHEVVGQIPGKKDIIIQELEKGYTFNGKVLRASKVLVGLG